MLFYYPYKFLVSITPPTLTLYSHMTIGFMTHTVVVLYCNCLPGPGPCQDTGLPRQHLSLHVYQMILLVTSCDGDCSWPELEDFLLPVTIWWTSPRSWICCCWWTCRNCDGRRCPSLNLAKVPEIDIFFQNYTWWVGRQNVPLLKLVIELWHVCHDG